MKRGGPSSALRLVGPGEDPRILSTDPDRFFGKPWPSLNAPAFFTLVVAPVKEGPAIRALRFSTVIRFGFGGAVMAGFLARMTSLLSPAFAEEMRRRGLLEARLRTCFKKP